jgi:hypothetical protein
MFSIQYESTHYYHPRHEAYWKACIHIGRLSLYLRALRFMSTHEVSSPRSTQMATLNDAARQALFAYQNYFDSNSEDEDRHYPLKCQGEIAARIAPVTGVDNARMATTVELLAILNTELSASLLELRWVHLQQERDWDALDNLQAILNE